MDLTTLSEAIRLVSNEAVPVGQPSETYLRTYPALLGAAKALPQTSETLLPQLATLAYGWMPRVCRLDRAYIADGEEALTAAMGVDSPRDDPSIVTRLADSLCSSVVGASKVLHLLRPDVFPIWDSNVAWFWQQLKGPAMRRPENYQTYAEQVERLTKERNFAPFYGRFDAAYSARLRRLQITAYSITPVRAVEAAAFELSARSPARSETGGR